MEYCINRNEGEIDALRNQCVKSEESGVSRHPAMTYEQGIEAAISWIMGEVDQYPIDD